MLTPFRLKANHPNIFVDPLSSNHCEIISPVVECCDLIGGYHGLEIENLPSIACDEVERSVNKIFCILGIQVN